MLKLLKLLLRQRSTAESQPRNSHMRNSTAPLLPSPGRCWRCLYAQRILNTQHQAWLMLIGSVVPKWNKKPIGPYIPSDSIRSSKNPWNAYLGWLAMSEQLCSAEILTGLLSRDSGVVLLASLGTLHWKPRRRHGSDLFRAVFRCSQVIYRHTHTYIYI